MAHQASSMSAGPSRQPSSSGSSEATANVPIISTGIEFGPNDSGKLSNEERHTYEFFYRKLKVFREQLPSHLLSKLPLPQLKELAHSLTDGTVFEIVRELEDIQKLTERSLLKKRMEVVNKHKTQKVELTKRHQQEMRSATDTKPHTVPLLKMKHETEYKDLEKKLVEEMKSMDKRIILELDQIVTDQQSTMHQCAVPFFYVTSCPQDVQLQMHLLRFLQKMSVMQQTTPS